MQPTRICTHLALVELYKQTPQSPRRNVLPTELIYWPFLMPHEHLACSPVELLEITKTSSGSDGVLHYSPEAFDGIEVVATMRW